MANYIKLETRISHISYLFSKMRAFVVLLCLFMWLGIGQDTSSEAQNTEFNVGEAIFGESSAETDGRSYHMIKIAEKTKKYLFFQFNHINEDQQGRIGITIYETGKQSPIFSCLNDTFDSCYMPSHKLHENTTLLVMVACQSTCNYQLNTHWGDLEHLHPNDKIRFRFNQANTSQLFHLKLEGQSFQQIRIVMTPETYRANQDNVKMYAKFGLNGEPTEEQHDLESVHVWNEAQAIFIDKDQTNGAEGLSLFITGNAKTIYTLSCEFITTKQHNIELNQTLYQYLEQEQKTYYKFTLPEDNDIDEYAIYFSIFTGDVGVGYSYDEKFEEKILESPIEYMNDIQMLINKKQLKEGTKQIYLQVESQQTKSTYMLQLQARKYREAHEIQQYVYQFVPVVNRTAVYFEDNIWTDTTLYESLEQAHYSITLLNIYGQPSFSFYVCLPQEQIQSCASLTNNEYKNHVKKIQTVGVSEVGMKRIYRLEVKKEMFKQINAVEKRTMVMIVFENSEDAGNSVVALEYANQKRVRLLRENRVVEEKIVGGQDKYYKYVNNDPRIKKVQVHVNSISGYIDTQAQRNDFRIGKDIPITPSPKHNTIIITNDLTQPIYIKVTGILNSIYTITITVSHADHPQTSSITLAEDVQYTFKLSGGQVINVELYPLYGSMIFEYSSEGGPVTVCQLDNNGLCQSPVNPGDITNNYGNITQEKRTKQSYRMRLYNSISTQTIEVKTIYHSSAQVSCLERHVNELYDQVRRTGECIKFTLPMATDVEIMVARTDIGNTYTLFTACSKTIQVKVSKMMEYLSGSEIKEKCVETPNDIVIVMYLANMNQTENQFKVQYLMQYRDDVITLKDGLAYTGRGISKEGVSRTFFYSLINAKDTEVILINRKGIQKFQTYLTTEKQKYLNMKPNKIMINSNESTYYSNPMIQLTKKQIEQAGCMPSCTLVINILSTEKAGTEIEYSIEVTQNSVTVHEDKVKNGFVSEGSFNYYEYYNKKSNSSIIVTVSDHNRHCVKVYFSNKQYPSKSNNIKIEEGNQLIYKGAKRSHYYIGVQGLDSCPYSISVSNSDVPITKIQTGQLYDLNLKENQRKYFLARHVSSESLKIVLLEKYGTIQIYANQTELDQNVLHQIKNDLLNEDNFNFQSQYKNSLSVKNTSENFCSDCYYLVMVVAERKVESSIFMGDSRSIIPLGDKILFDELHEQGESTLARFYKISAGTLLVKVHSGSIKLSLTYEDDTIENTYNRSKKVQHTPYNFTKSPSNFNPIMVNVTGLTVPAFYSIQLRPKKGETNLQYYDLKPREHTYMFLDEGKIGCVQGYLSSEDDEIIITTNVEYSDKLKRIGITGNLDGNDKISIINQTVGNVMSVKYEVRNFFINDAIPFQLCLNSGEGESISLIVMQGEDLNLLPPDTETIVSEEKKFVLHPNGDFIFDVFTCKGQTQIQHTSNLKQLGQGTMKAVDMMGIPGQSHAVRINSYSTIFMEVKGELSTVSWMPMDEKKDMGLGYMKYGIGELDYDSVFNKIEFSIGGVKQKKSTSNHVEILIYNLYISNSKQKLKEAVMCEKLDIEGVEKVQVGVYNASVLNKTIHTTFEKNTLAEKFSPNETLYFNAVADLVLSVPQQGQMESLNEHYRFIYYEQTVPAEVFLELSIHDMKLQTFIIVSVVVVVALVIIAYIFVKWIVPAIGKLKNRMFVEEAEQNKNDQSIPVPPSSDRNQIQNQVETEQKMK